MSPEEFLNEFGHLAETEGGVSQVRSAIYQLAIKGGVVPQDSSEEPARVLLQKLGVNMGPGLAWDDWNLPDGWEACVLEDLCSRVHYGVTAKAMDTPKGPRMLRITDIQNDRVNWDTVPGCDIDASASENAALADGDLLIARTGGTIGKTYLVENLDRAAVFASYLIRAVPLSTSLSPYLKLYTGSAFYWEQLRAGTAGTGLPNVSGTKLKALKVPLPPLPEQKRIVEKVDQLMALCDELEAKQKEKREKSVSFNKAALNAVVHAPDKSKLKSSWSRVQDHFEVLYELPENVKELRQTILQLAVMGKLVRQDPNEEHAEKLLSRVAKERDTAYSTKAYRRAKEPDGPLQGAMDFPLPQNWAWSQLGELCFSVSDGPHHSPRYVNETDGVPMLSTRHIADGVLDFSDLKYVSRQEFEEYIKRGRPEIGDILYSKGGTTGVAVVNTWDREFCVWVHLALLKLVKSEIEPHYLALVLNSPHGFWQSQKLTHGIGNKDLGLTRMVRITVPVPPHSEQKRILKEVFRLTKLCDQLEERLQSSAKRGQELMRAVVESLVA